MRSAMCPNCNANVTIKEDNRDFCFCEYCGAKIMLDDYRSTYRVIDEAKIKQVEHEHYYRMRELELEEKSRQKFEKLHSVLIKIWLIITIFFIVIILLSGFFAPEDSMITLALVEFSVLVVGGGAYLTFKILPERETNKELAKIGGIKIPKSLEPLSQQNFQTVSSTLSGIGFTNISCVNMHDVKIGVLQKSGVVESITIDGKNVKIGGKMYMPSDKIVIIYHGK